LADEPRTRLKYAPGTARREIPAQARNSLQASRPPPAGHAGHRRSPGAGGDFRERVLLAWALPMPPIKAAVNEAEILGG
jgi:hypothetical protein